MRAVDDATVRRVLTPRTAYDAVRDVLIAAARGDAACPVRSVIATGGAWFASMPAHVRGAAPALGVKLVSANPANVAAGLPTHHAVVVLFDARTGVPDAIVAGDAITELRTAAASVLATERLAARPRGAYAMLGAGVQARAHVDAFADAQLLEQLRVWSRTPAHAEALARYARERGLRAGTAATPEAALDGADVVVTATGSATPLFPANALPPGAHVNAVGACVPDRRELPADAIAAAALYADDTAAIRREAGDLLLAERDLGRTIAVRASLGEMLARPDRRDAPARFTVFESLGIGIEDVACAAFVLAAAG